MWKRIKEEFTSDVPLEPVLRITEVINEDEVVLRRTIEKLKNGKVVSITSEDMQEKIEVNENDYSIDLEKNELIRVIECLLKKTKEHKIKWHLNKANKKHPYDVFWASLDMKHYLTIEKGMFFIVSVTDDLIDGCSIFNGTYHNHYACEKSHAYQVCEELWASILKQPEYIKNKCNEIIEGLNRVDKDE
jgi:hypothetical protein